MDKWEEIWVEGNVNKFGFLCVNQVLWADSGWKPVPLSDIIEGRTVKKSYQKALLCLHPDKLQQKGAAPYKKYIAEKVFDILQVIYIFFSFWLQKMNIPHLKHLLQSQKHRFLLPSCLSYG